MEQIANLLSRSFQNAVYLILHSNPKARILLYLTSCYTLQSLYYGTNSAYSASLTKMQYMTHILLNQNFHKCLL